ncbi:MAG: reverse transcriptase N-terminal domain-containing protein [Eggerthellaceae bacterium]|nr:reverse transcriptase N-terminal domain-containing protein [Eggerthellaceae bacterium]
MTLVGKLDPDSDFLADMWDSIDWRAAEDRLADLQRRLAKAAADFDRQAVIKLQDVIVSDLDCRCLAVRKVAKPHSGPGIDGVRWTTSGQKMTGALALTPVDYRAKPQRLIELKPHKGRSRRVKLSTYHDRAMATLYSFALAPVTEASAERKSFAFRKGRSAHDAVKYITDMFSGASAPKFVLVCDVKAYYANISHEWLMAHAPMDKDVLREFLGAGVVYAHAFFPADDHGISLGNPLSPMLGNFVLDGLQRTVFKALNPYGDVTDYANGNLVRFADDIIVSLRTSEAVETARKAIADFCAERGLALNDEKTFSHTTYEPFDFLGYTFCRQDDRIYSRPSDDAVERFAAELKTDISGWKKSQRKLIEHLNSRLKGWAGYYRYGDSQDAFNYIDHAVTAALFEAVVERHPKRKVKQLVAKYWYEESDGTHSYTLPNDRTVKVYHIAETPIAQHRKVRAVSNPYLDPEYFEQRQEERDIVNVSGPWRSVWDRQRGICHYCGTPILADQPKLVVAKGNQAKVTPRNAAYIHEACAFDEVSTLMLDTPADFAHYDVVKALEPIASQARGEWRPLPPNWRYRPLLDYFSHLDKKRVTLSFADIEAILGGPLPVHAGNDKSWWKFKPGRTCPPRSWVDGGYDLAEVDLKKRRARFVRTDEAGVPLILPPELSGRVPDNAAFEFETFCHDLIQRYGL